LLLPCPKRKSNIRGQFLFTFSWVMKMEGEKEVLFSVIICEVKGEEDID
jgi:hypothetical protein